MCSVLLVLLFFTAVFIPIHDFAQQFEYSPSTGSKRPCESTQELVSFSQRLDRARQAFPPEDQIGFTETSQQRFRLPSPDRQSDESRLRGDNRIRKLALEMPVWQDQQKVVPGMCSVLRTLVQWHAPSNPAESTGGSYMERIRLGRMERPLEVFKQVLNKIPTGPQDEIEKAISKGQSEPERQREERKRRTGEARRANFAVSGRFQKFCLLVYHGCLHFHTDLLAHAQSFCRSELFESGGREARMARGPTQSISRPGYHAGGHQALGGEDKKGLWEKGHQEPSPGFYVSWEDEGSSGRGHRQTQGTSLSLDEAPGKWYSDMGATARGVPQASGLHHRTGREGQDRNHGYEPVDPAAQPHCWWGSSAYSGATIRGSGRASGGSRGQGRGCYAESASSCTSKLCQFIGTRIGNSQSGRGSRRQDRGGGCFWGQTPKAAPLYGAICQIVIFGRELGVHCYPDHGAKQEAVHALSSNAYQLSFWPSGAASVEENALFPCLSHSIQSDPLHIDPFKACTMAFCLQWEVLKDLFNSSIEMPDIILRARSTNDGISQSSDSVDSKKLRVRFQEHIDVYLGLDESLEMYSLRVNQSSLSQWADKPWSRVRTSPATSRSCSPNWQKDVHDFAQHFLFGTREIFESPYGFSFPSQAPLSAQAVLSRVGFELVDEISFMQGHARTFKQSPHTEQQEALLDGVEGRATLADVDNSDESSLSDHDRRSSSPEEAPSSESSGVQPPSSVGGRQEVIMFHLDDPPIRAFLDWSDYFRMITEIAHHFATEPANVVDAYEINTEVKGLPPDAVPIIVHLFPDIAVGQMSKLVLIDLEIHAHRTEPSFRIGPVTQRFVQPIPHLCDRHDALEALNVDRYCQQERDRCFVWHDSVWWSVEDLQPKLISHGDHVRVAVPPSERYECATSQLIEWSQDGLSNHEILDQLAAPEASAGYSPSPLNDEEVRNLASPSALAAQMADDSFSSMQTILNLEANDTSATSSSSVFTASYWIHDLTRQRQLYLDQLYAANIIPDDDESFQVYTWFLDHSATRVCLAPKIVTLDDHSEDWELHITEPWKSYISRSERIFIDVVLPTPPASQVEDHVAHVLITQHATDRNSVLLSVSIEEVSTRFAITVPTLAVWTDFAENVPVLQGVEEKQIKWIMPDLPTVASSIHVWPGRGLHIRRLGTDDPLACSDVTIPSYSRHQFVGKHCQPCRDP